ncbi:MAG TPA: VOC family protein [Anaeromyxobacteraceae bacterium]|nr:VOC family protein [Anaeromyxobacteraceae bacterium]
MPAALDHLIVGIDDLDRGIAEIERRTGARAVPGGSHPGRGTSWAVHTPDIERSTPPPDIAGA